MRNGAGPAHSTSMLPRSVRSGLLIAVMVTMHGTPATIRESCRTAGVREVHDPGTCTSRDLRRYYSYRAEKGQTGRLLAVLGWASD